MYYPFLALRRIGEYISLDLQQLFTHSSAGKRRTEKAGAMLTRVRFPGAARDFSPSPQLSAQSRSPALFVQLHVCNRMHPYLRARSKSEGLVATQLF